MGLQILDNTMKSTIILFAASLVASVGASNDPRECDVCMKVMADVKALMPKADQKVKPKIEKALGEYCADAEKKLSARERKICYHIDPIKRDVAHPFSLGMPNDRLCKRINKANSEICSVKFPVKTKNMTKLRVKQLKSILLDRGVECKGCVEK